MNHRLTKEQAAIYAAGVFDSSGTIAPTRPLASALKDTKKHKMLETLHKHFKGQLIDTPGQGKGEGKTFVQWHITDKRQRVAFFKAISPYTVATESVEHHIEALET